MDDFEEITARAYAGDTEAQVLLGDYYASCGGEEEDVTAYDWYRRAADRGSVEGLYKLGKCYYMGAGIERIFRGR